MILTEDEAKTKSCQETFAAYDGQMHVERGRRVAIDMLNCIGTACMAWRWDEGSKWSGPPTATTRADQKDWKGYCGKAGRP